MSLDYNGQVLQHVKVSQDGDIYPPKKYYFQTGYVINDPSILTVSNVAIVPTYTGDYLLEVLEIDPVNNLNITVSELPEWVTNIATSGAITIKEGYYNIKAKFTNTSVGVNVNGVISLALLYVPSIEFALNPIILSIKTQRMIFTNPSTSNITVEDNVHFTTPLTDLYTAIRFVGDTEELIDRGPDGPYYIEITRLG